MWRSQQEAPHLTPSSLARPLICINLSVALHCIASSPWRFPTTIVSLHHQVWTEARMSQSRRPMKSQFPMCSRRPPSGHTASLVTQTCASLPLTDCRTRVASVLIDVAVFRFHDIQPCHLHYRELVSFLVVLLHCLICWPSR